MSRKTGVPNSITDEIRNLCSSIINTTVPIYVPVRTYEKARAGECFYNVDYMVKKYGGEPILGWAIWQWPNILIEAEAHAIWKMPNGESVDVTPHIAGEGQILFLEDIMMKYENNPIANKRQALTNSLLVDEFIQIANKKDEIMCSSKEITYSLPRDLVKRYIELGLIFNQKVSRNKKCPCQSGLKYKDCCGGSLRNINEE